VLHYGPALSLLYIPSAALHITVQAHQVSLHPLTLSPIMCCCAANYRACPQPLPHESRTGGAPSCCSEHTSTGKTSVGPSTCMHHPPLHCTLVSICARPVPPSAVRRSRSLRGCKSTPVTAGGTALQAVHPGGLQSAFPETSLHPSALRSCPFLSPYCLALYCLFLPRPVLPTCSAVPAGGRTAGAGRSRGPLGGGAARGRRPSLGPLRRWPSPRGLGLLPDKAVLTRGQVSSRAQSSPVSSATASIPWPLSL